ncbi:hypothetical protein PF003_g2917 [Phytophthora fragariae]|nr:hypothetical protein PF003_g2917 [Phytophthora fragariae]
MRRVSTAEGFWNGSAPASHAAHFAGHELVPGVREMLAQRGLIGSLLSRERDGERQAVGLHKLAQSLLLQLASQMTSPLSNIMHSTTLYAAAASVTSALAKAMYMAWTSASAIFSSVRDFPSLAPTTTNKITSLGSSSSLTLSTILTAGSDFLATHFSTSADVRPPS